MMGDVEKIAALVEEAAVDRQLLVAVKNGDREALAALYDRHATVLLVVAYRILQNRRDAEDLLHDVFVEAWQKIDGFDQSRGSVRSWLLVRLRSRAIDRVRSLARMRRHVSSNTDAAENVGCESVQPAEQLDRSRARRALHFLSEAQRFVIELNYFKGLTCREIAAQYDIPEGTVKSRLITGIRVLRKHLVPNLSES